MNIFPDWAPNIHPLFVHFPIALIFVAVFFDAIRLFLRQHWIENTAVSLYALGTLGVIASYWSGSMAAEVVRIPVQAQAVMTDHENMALVTLIFFLAFLPLRTTASWFRLNRNPLIQTLLVAGGILGCYFVWNTADHGARLVFQHGVGVAAAERDDVIREPDQPIDPETISRPEMDDDGSWRWQIGANAVHALEEDFDWLDGSSAVASEENGLLTFNMQGETAMFVLGEDLRSLSAAADINLDDFDGIFRIIYHVSDRANFGFMEISEDRMGLGQSVNGNIRIYEENRYSPGGWTTLRTTADGRHFYGFSDDETITHGHADELAPGKTGLFIEGSGQVRLRGMEIHVLR